MAVHAIDFGIAQAAAVMNERRHDFSASLRREAPVGRKRNYQKVSFSLRERGIKAPARLCGRIEIVQRFGGQ